jgi:hypothetical protein
MTQLDLLHAAHAEINADMLTSNMRLSLNIHRVEY